MPLVAISATLWLSSLFRPRAYSDVHRRHRQSAGDLGVRVQTGGMTSNPTARKAINNVITREALINCDFSGNVLDGVDQAEVYIRDAYILRDMRKDYNLFNSQLGILGTEKETFTKYLLKEKTISDIAEDQGITYESARQQMQKIKVRMKKQEIADTQDSLEEAKATEEWQYECMVIRVRDMYERNETSYINARSEEHTSELQSLS